MVDNTKIAHFVIDDKFTDSAYWLFEAVSPSCNDYYIVSLNNTLKFVRDTPAVIINNLAFKNPSFMRSLNKYDFIVLHALTKFNQELVSHSSDNIKFVWIGMGFDYYDFIYDSREALYFDETSGIARQFDYDFLNRTSWLKKLGKKIINQYRHNRKKEVVKRIDYFSPVLESEYNMVRKRFDSKFPKYVKWNYGVAAQLVDSKLKENRVTGKNILLGNSATLTNNHIEVINYLKNIDLNGKKIICPLNYGNNDYGDYIANKGAINFGNGFVSIREFMPFGEYVKTISSCSNVIMNNIRQQAGGNVVATLFMGAKVFLNEINPLYDHYITNGVKLFTIEELYAEPKMLDIPLSEEDIQNNRAIIRSLVGGQTQIDKTINLIAQVSAN